MIFFSNCGIPGIPWANSSCLTTQDRAVWAVALGQFWLAILSRTGQSWRRRGRGTGLQPQSADSESWRKSTPWVGEPIVFFLERRPLSRQGRPISIIITGSASSAPGAGVCQTTRMFHAIHHQLPLRGSVKGATHRWLPSDE